MALVCRVPTDEDVWLLGALMRQADRDELAAVCDLSAHEAVVASVQAADDEFLKVWLDESGQLLGISGCSPVAAGRAAPWLLATDLLDGCWFTLHRQALRELGLMRMKYPVLSNVVDVRQVKVVGWLQRLGFELRAAEAWKEGFALVRFEMG